jgi:hypothetical protein
MGRTEFRSDFDYKRAWVGKGKTFNESEMALFFECMPPCARKLLDTADIVRDAIFREQSQALSGWCCLTDPRIMFTGGRFRFRQRHCSSNTSTFTVAINPELSAQLPDTLFHASQTNPDPRSGFVKALERL